MNMPSMFQRIGVYIFQLTRCVGAELQLNMPWMFLNLGIIEASQASHALSVEKIRPVKCHLASQARSTSALKMKGGSLESYDTQMQISEGMCGICYHDFPTDDRCISSRAPRYSNIV